MIIKNINHKPQTSNFPIVLRSTTSHYQTPPFPYYSSSESYVRITATVAVVVIGAAVGRRHEGVVAISRILDYYFLLLHYLLHLHLWLVAQLQWESPKGPHGAGARCAHQRSSKRLFDGKASVALRPRKRPQQLFAIPQSRHREGRSWHTCR